MRPCSPLKWLIAAGGGPSLGAAQDKKSKKQAKKDAEKDAKKKKVPLCHLVAGTFRCGV